MISINDLYGLFKSRNNTIYKEVKCLELITRNVSKYNWNIPKM